MSINRFISDTDEEIDIVVKWCQKMSIKVAICEGWEKGGEGATALARQVVSAVESCKSKYKPVYHWDDTVQEKIEAVARKIYGASDVEFLPKAKQNLRKIERIGLNDKPICIAKTQYSFSDDPKALGKPEKFTLTVREIEIAAGAGFSIPITGNMLRMPGLPGTPAAEGMDIDNDGKITGLS